MKIIGLREQKKHRIQLKCRMEWIVFHSNPQQHRLQLCSRLGIDGTILLLLLYQRRIWCTRFQSCIEHCRLRQSMMFHLKFLCLRLKLNLSKLPLEQVLVHSFQLKLFHNFLFIRFSNYHVKLCFQLSFSTQHKESQYIQHLYSE